MATKEKTVTAPPPVLVKFAQAFVEAERRVAEIGEMLKKAKVVSEITEKKLVDQMTTEQVRSFRTEFGGFNSQVKVYPNIVDAEALGAWIKRKPTLKWLYTTQVHGGKFKSYVRELMEKGEEIPPGVEPFMKTVVRRFK